MSRLALEGGTVEQLRPRIRGCLVTPDDPAYDEARRVCSGTQGTSSGSTGTSSRLASRR